MGEYPEHEAFDPILAGFASMADHISVSLVLTIDGMLISGKTVGFRTFLRGVEDRVAVEGTELTVKLSQRFRGLLERLDMHAAEPRRSDTIYLRDVMISAPAGPISQPWWSGRLSAVTGWWIGPAEPFMEPANEE